MDEARASCAIDISGRPFCVVRRPRLPPGATGGFDHELLEEFFRAVANNARLTLHLDVEAGTNAHHMIEAPSRRSRARCAARSRSTRRETGVPSTKGTLDRHEHRASSTTGWATAARSRRRSSTSARDRGPHRRPRRAARGRRPRRARRRRVPRGDAAACARSASTTLVRERAAAGVPVIGLCLGHAAALRVLRRARGRATGSGCCPGAIVALDTRGLKLAAHRLERGLAGSAPSPLIEGLPDPAAFYHVHSYVAAARRPGRRARHGRVRLAVRLVRRARQRLRRPVPPREVLDRRPRAAAQLRRHLRDRDAARDPLSRRSTSPTGKAVRLVQGDFDDETVYDDDPLDAAKAWVEAGARYLHVVDLDGARTGSPQNLAPPRADRPRARRAGAVRRRPALAAGGARRAARRAPSASSSARRRSPTSTSSTRSSRPTASGSSSRVDTRGGYVSTAGWTETTQMPADGVIERLQDRGVRTFVYTNVDKDGMLEGIDLDEVRAIAERRARALPVLGRDRHARGPRGARRRCARSTSPA